MVGVGWPHGVLSRIVIHSGLYWVPSKPNSLHHRPLKGKDKVQLWFPLKPPNSLNSFLKGQRNHPYPFPALEPVFYKMFGHFQQ